MGQDSDPGKSGIIHPSRPVSRKTAEPILYLADRMASADQDAVPREMRVISQIADAVGMPTYRQQPWFRDMTEAAALKRLNTDLAKRAALVVLSLVLKADTKRKPSEQEYFTHIRESLGAEPVTVPLEVEEHKQLALEYFVEKNLRPTSPR